MLGAKNSVKYHPSTSLFGVDECNVISITNLRVESDEGLSDTST